MLEVAYANPDRESFIFFYLISVYAITVVLIGFKYFLLS
jgi:hypothetical protein